MFVKKRKARPFIGLGLLILGAADSMFAVRWQPALAQPELPLSHRRTQLRRVLIRSLPPEHQAACNTRYNSAVQ